MKVKRFVLRRSELIVYIAFVIGGIYLTYYGSAIYGEALLSREPEIPKGICLVSVIQIPEIESLWFSIQLPNSTHITEEAQARVDLTIFLNWSDVVSLFGYQPGILNITIAVPGVAENLRCEGQGISPIREPVTCIYEESIDSTGFSFGWAIDLMEGADHFETLIIGIVTFDWTILMRESYDEYGMIIPIPPSQALLHDYDLYYIHEFRLLVTLGEGEALDLFETFPPPDSYTRGFRRDALPQPSESYDVYAKIGFFPTYEWEFGVEEVHPLHTADVYFWLRELTHVVFSLDDLRLEKEKILFTSGIYFGLGTSTIFTGAYSLLQMLAHREQVAIENKGKST